MVRWIKGAAAVTLAALSVACVGADVDAIDPATAPIVARVDCDDALASECDRAAGVWNEGLAGTRWRLVRAGEATIAIPVRVVHGNASTCFGEAAWNGCTRDGRQVEINVDATIGWDDRAGGTVGIIAHELGHAMGLGHLASGLMSSQRRYDLQCVDALTADAIGGVATCP